MDIEANKADTENAHYPMPFGLCVFVTIWILGCFALIGSGINFLVQSAAMDPSEDFFSLGKVCNITKVRHPVGQEREAKKDRQGRKKESSNGCVDTYEYRFAVGGGYREKWPKNKGGPTEKKTRCGDCPCDASRDPRNNRWDVV